MSAHIISSEAADLVIIGGGLWGLSIAWHYARLDTGRVIVLERNALASAATSRAAALLTRARAKTVLMPLIAQTYADLAILEEEGNESLDLRQVGSLHVAASATRQRELCELVTIAEQAGLRVESVSADEASRRAPWLNPAGIATAAFMPEDAFIDPYRLAMAYAQSARMHGAILRPGVAVHDLRRQGDRVTGVVTDRGIVYAGCVVNAAGAWANRLTLPLGVGLPMTPVRSQYWLTTPDALFPRDHPMVIMPDANAYSRPELGGLLFGLRERQSVSVDPRDLPDRMDGFALGEAGGWSSLVAGAPALRRFLPALDRLEIAHHMTGLSTYVPDSSLILGPMPEWRGLLAAAGCSGAGIAASGGVGQGIAALATGQPNPFDLAPFGADRFGKVDPLSLEFRQRCEQARSSKVSG
ncbi:MAG: FAD-binding oxidoreductase [Gammaproteobacteria bacterium]|nr:FAD-binding oxidoreductase [Gammaproteobacteria bacterium]